MSDVIIGTGLERTEIDTPFREISFTDARAEEKASTSPMVRILPELNVLKIGGQSIMDRGAAAVNPILEMVAELKDEHQLFLGVGGGTRARHAYAVALDMGMPTSILSKIGQAVPRQNARMLQMLLAKHGGILIDIDDFAKLPLYYKLGCIAIMPGMPPYDYWEKPAATGRIPTNRTDSGVYLSAEVLGARTCIYVKDEKGLYTANPKMSKSATFIDKIHAGELLERGLPDLIVEPVVLENMLNAKSMKQIQIINGLEPENIRRAINGEHVGTIIHAD